MAIFGSVIGDAIITFLWVLSSSALGPLTSILATSIHLQGAATLLIVVTLLSILLFLFAFLGAILGGASFNPTDTVSLYAVGVGQDSLISMALRLPAQAVGAVGGAVAIKRFMPSQYGHMLPIPSLKVDVHSGALMEGALTFAMTFFVLLVIHRGPKNNFFRAVILAAFSMVLILTGSAYTGPSMNPANAFGWAYMYDRHNTWEQFYVYWICPFVGCLLAAWIFRVLFPLPSVSKRKAE